MTKLGGGGNPTIIGEEWILAKDKNIFNVVRHEISHQIHSNILHKGVCKKINSAYQNAKRKKLFIRENSAMNFWEYFADGVTFYFNTDSSRRIRIYDMKQVCNRRLLLKKDRILYNLIKEIFEKK